MGQVSTGDWSGFEDMLHWNPDFESYVAGRNIWNFHARNSPAGDGGPDHGDINGMESMALSIERSMERGGGGGSGVQEGNNNIGGGGGVGNNLGGVETRKMR